MDCVGLCWTVLDCAEGADLYWFKHSFCTLLFRSAAMRCNGNKHLRLLSQSLRKVNLPLKASQTRLDLGRRTFHLNPLKNKSNTPRLRSADVMPRCSSSNSLPYLVRAHHLCKNSIIEGRNVQAVIKTGSSSNRRTFGTTQVIVSACGTFRLKARHVAQCAILLNEAVALRV